MKKGNKLKRPGSPNLSDSSGNESTRKKVKTGKGTSSHVPSRSGTPLPGRPKGAAGGATSDGEATAGEGSDGGLKLKKKIKIKSGTPSASRAGSPAPPGKFPPPCSGIGVSAKNHCFRRVASQNNNKSPGKAGSATPRNSPPPPQVSVKPIELSEITDVFRANPEGISLGNLLRKFAARVDKGATTKIEWMAMVKKIATLGSDKLLHPIAQPGV